MKGLLQPISPPTGSVVHAPSSPEFSPACAQPSLVCIPSRTFTGRLGSESLPSWHVLIR